MISFSLKKIYFETTTSQVTGQVVTQEKESPDQTFATLKENEEIVVSVNKVPFVEFRIAPIAEKYSLTSVSPVSLRTYQTLADNKREDWGMYMQIGYCINQVLSVMAGFINRMGKEEINDGDYYGDNACGCETCH